MLLVLRQPVYNVREICHESGLPRWKGGGHVPKVVFILFFPETPRGHKENVHDQFISMPRLEVGHHIQAIASGRPTNVKLTPALLTERPMEEKMLHHFFNVVTTQQTIKVGSNVIMRLFQHVACVETTRKQEPTKDFDFRGALGAPDPLISHMSHHVTKEKLVVCYSFEDSAPRAIGPNILTIVKRNIRNIKL